MTKESWQQQKVLKQNKQDVSPNDIIIMAKKIKKERDRVLFVILYLTAGRVSEVVRSLYRKDITEQIADNRRIILFKLNNRKNKDKVFKELPIPYDKEKDLLDMIFPYLDRMEMEHCIFPISKTRAYQIIKKEFGWNPHWIRHIRLTNLVTYQDFNDQFLVKFNGWCDSRPARSYMEHRWKDILQKY